MIQTMVKFCLLSIFWVVLQAQMPSNSVVESSFKTVVDSCYKATVEHKETIICKQGPSIPR